MNLRLIRKKEENCEIKFIQTRLTRRPIDVQISLFIDNLNATHGFPEIYQYLYDAIHDDKWYDYAANLDDPYSFDFQLAQLVRCYGKDELERFIKQIE